MLIGSRWMLLMSSAMTETAIRVRSSASKVHLGRIQVGLLVMDERWILVSTTRVALVISIQLMHGTANTWTLYAAAKYESFEYAISHPLHHFQLRTKFHSILDFRNFIENRNVSPVSVNALHKAVKGCSDGDESASSSQTTKMLSDVVYHW